MRFLKILIFLIASINSLSVYKRQIQELKELLTALEDAEIEEKNMKRIEGLLSRKHRHVESRVLEYLNRLRQSYHKSTNRLALNYVKNDRHKVATISSPHHRRISNPSKPRRRQKSPIPMRNG